MHARFAPLKDAFVCEQGQAERAGGEDGSVACGFWGGGKGWKGEDGDGDGDGDDLNGLGRMGEGDLRGGGGGGLGGGLGGLWFGGVSVRCGGEGEGFVGSGGR